MYLARVQEHKERDGQFLSGVEHVWIPRLPFIRPIAKQMLKNPVCPYIHP